LRRLPLARAQQKGGFDVCCGDIPLLMSSLSHSTPDENPLSAPLAYNSDEGIGSASGDARLPQTARHLYLPPALITQNKVSWD